MGGGVPSIRRLVLLFVGILWLCSRGIGCCDCCMWVQLGHIGGCYAGVQGYRCLIVRPALDVVYHNDSPRTVRLVGRWVNGSLAYEGGDNICAPAAVVWLYTKAVLVIGRGYVDLVRRRTFLYGGDVYSEHRRYGYLRDVVGPRRAVQVRADVGYV